MYVIILYKIIIFSYVNFYECILIKPVQRTGYISSFIWILRCWLVFIYGLIHVYPCNISDLRFIPCKKFCLDSNPAIWRFLVLNLHEFWQSKIDDMTRGKLKYLTGGKPNFSQITRGESTLNFVIWCCEGPKSKNLQITELKSKQFFLQEVNRKSLIL